ncbi:MAG: cation transporter [Bacteroidales bacterium]|jgi:copper chaperone CopZ
MKTKILILMTGILLIGMGAFASGKKTEKINVAGKCGMCETRIEKAALAIDGVKKADYDLKTKTLAVTFDEKKTSVDGIEKAEAAVGHDTDNHKADDAVYNKLPGCCKYRK